MRPSIVAVVVTGLLAMPQPFAVAQDAAPAAAGPDAPAVVVVSPPPMQVPVPAGPATRPAGPQALVGKSIRDLSRGALGAVVTDDVTALRRGPLLIHGNYCGIGNRPGSVPVDALDAACMRHDACTHTGKLPSCACDDHLRLEATVIAQDPRTSPELRVTAAATATAMAVLVCKFAPKS